MTNGPEPPIERFPEWARRIDCPVWVSGPDRNIHFINEGAERLLDIAEDESVGRPCYEVIGLQDEQGREFCSRECPLNVDTKNRRPLRPILLRPRRRPERQILLLALAPITERGDEAWFVHCAIDATRTCRLRDFLGRVTRCSPEPPSHDHGLERLTHREKEVLELLSENLHAGEIARRLHISRATVRNHIQRLLAKLDAHSILEAVAVYLCRGSADGNP